MYVLRSTAIWPNSTIFIYVSDTPQWHNIPQQGDYHTGQHHRVNWIFTECLYSATFSIQSAQVWITQFYLLITPCLPFLCKRSPDGDTPNWGSRHPIAAYYSFIDPRGLKSWVGLVGWLIADRLPIGVVAHQLQVKHREDHWIKADVLPLC